MDLILRNARIEGEPRPVDIAADGGRILAISDAAARAGANGFARELDVGGRFVSPGLVETHLHLDKSCILDRCVSREGTLAEAIAQVASAKAAFTAEDVHARAVRTLERAILQGTTHMRTQLEVDPGIGLRGLDGVLPLVDEYRFAIDIEICVFPQEGLTNNPGTEPLLVECLRRGAARVLGAAPYVDTDPHAQIDRVFAIARDFDVDVDMHLDFTLDVQRMDVDYVCEATRRHRYEGRVTIGHVSTLSALPSAAFAATATRLRDAGVAVTVMPATDLFLMGRGADHDVPRGVAPVHRLAQAGVNGSLSTNNVLNPFTPFGDCSLMRIANLYANACQVGDAAGIAECYRMITSRAAGILKVPDYGIGVGNAADLVVFDCENAAQAVAEIAPPLWAFKRGRMTMSRAPAVLHRP
jgi:cytosine deaminase